MYCFVNFVPAKNPVFTILHIGWNTARNLFIAINFYAMLASGSDLRIMRGLVVVDSRFNLNLS
ncbi:hypothetical protein EYS06_22145 [Escherichia albertii]|uniref:Uncharacterized protein n=1 Tax=Escherichia albertii TaxID=208962 RepID=A0A7Z8DX98_ESCAL|nr:hypothetical protein EYS06_22145 [Escherichia albertii]